MIYREVTIISSKRKTKDSKLASNETAHRLLSAYLKIRKATEEICKPLQTEDYVIQTMDDVSPPKWHLGHTTWFFETFVLAKYKVDYKVYHEKYSFIFNSYYESIGNRILRSKRGLLARPTVSEVYKYREYIDLQMVELFELINEKDWDTFSYIVELGLNHEEQHQELLLTDIKHIFAMNPLKPIFVPLRHWTQIADIPDSSYLSFDERIINIGHQDKGFCYDNELPVHKVHVNEFKLQNRLVTNREFLDFINDGGYSNPKLWLSDAWDSVKNEKWNSPLYWEKYDNEWFIMTLSGLQKLVLSEPVSHVSYYEADAFARWSGKRLPTEIEWEYAMSTSKINSSGNFMEKKIYHPALLINYDASSLHQGLGDVWEWTSSAYLPYPGYKQPRGAFGEYNGKFMCNQMVVRGGSCVTPSRHIRLTYRNFFYPNKRWQFTGIRLADDK